MKPSAAATAPPSDEYDEQAYYRQVRMRRRKLLYVFLLFASLAMLAIFLELFLLSLRKEIGIENLDRFGQAMIVALLATLVTYLWARRDSNAAAFFFLSVCVAIATFIDSPREVTAGRSLISFPIIIMAAGLLLPAWAAFVFAGLSTAAVTLLSLFVTYNIAQPLSDAIVFLLVATVIWYFATRLEHANAALARSRADFHLLFAENPLPMALFNSATLQVLDVNHAAVAQYGYTREQFGHMPAAKIVVERRPPAGPSDRTGRDAPYKEDQRHRTAGGEIIDVAITMHHTRYAGRAVSLVVAENISERVRRQEALHTLNAELERRVEERTAELRTANAELARSNRLKDEFLATMSHELRTPLTGVLALSEALAEQIYGSLLDRQLRAVQAIRSSGVRLLKLINNVLDFAQAGAGLLEITLQSVPVDDACQAAASVARQLAAAKQQQVTATNGCGRGSMVWADPARLQQVLHELLANAVKFTPAEGMVGLQAVPGSAPDSVEIVVWDTGIGIAQEDLPHLFDPFHQVDSRLSRSYEGAGLGLALVERLVLLQGGGICVASVPGEGSRFTVTLPCRAHSAEILR